VSNRVITYAKLTGPIFVAGEFGGSIGPTLSIGAPGSKIKSMQLEDGLLFITTLKGEEVITPASNIEVMKAASKPVEQVTLKTK